jgi:hypothetical protein
MWDDKPCVDVGGWWAFPLELVRSSEHLIQAYYNWAHSFALVIVAFELHFLLPVVNRVGVAQIQKSPKSFLNWNLEIFQKTIQLELPTFYELPEIKQIIQKAYPELPGLFSLRFAIYSSSSFEPLSNSTSSTLSGLLSFTS